MPPAEEADEKLLDHRILADDHLPQLLPNPLDGRGKLFDQLNIRGRGRGKCLVVRSSIQSLCSLCRCG